MVIIDYLCTTKEKDMIVVYDKNIENNKNTGISYEISVFLAIVEYFGGDTTDLINDISNREDFNSIIENSNKMKSFDFSNFFKKYNLSEVNKINLTTQDDTVGPSDIVINDNFGISIKYDNKCNFNPTGRRFLSRTDISEFKKDLKNYSNSYVSEMNEKYGVVNNWFRNRGCKSETINVIINTLKSKVVSNWDSMSLTDKNKIIGDIYHLNSPIDYVIMKIDKKINISIDDKPFNFDVSKIKLVNEENSHYVTFTYENDVIGKMQVKFNNGMLENYKGKSKPDVVIGDYRIKYGNAISSWNFNLN